VRNFNVLLATQWKQSRFLCVGLDTGITKIPAHIVGTTEERIFTFNRDLIDATHDQVCAFKINAAFYEAYGDAGWRALKNTCDYIRSVAPDVAVILDAKRGDIGNTNDGYATMAFDWLGADALTVQPYMGGEALRPIFERKDKGIFVLCRTSNEGAGEFQDLIVDDEPLYLHVARNVTNTWNAQGNCGLVVGATVPEELRKVRELAPDMPFLIPGIGAQGGDLEEVVKAGKHAMIIAVSRAVQYASGSTDFAAVARAKVLEYNASIREAML
jgi:orotidine-5'-phosphate decarboxylase